VVHRSSFIVEGGVANTKNIKAGYINFNFEPRTAK
jgi:hypothetical protein